MFKHSTKMFALLFVFASIVMFIGCQDQQSVVTPDSNQVSLPKYSLPAGETLVSAKLYMWEYVHAVSVPQVINIHKVTSDWQENVVTWNSFAGAYKPERDTFFIADTYEWNSADITSIVQDWLNGETNYGILLKNRDLINNEYAYWSSKDGYEHLPYLEIVTNSGTTQLSVLADAYIRELNPGTNYGSLVFNYSGFEGDPAKEKQTLMRFDIEPTPPQCWQDETAWVANTGPLTNRYVTKGNWATWISYTGSKVYNIYAGQTTLVGTASLSPNVDPNKVDIVISLTAPWALDADVTQSVKIQGYTNTPPASNPNPGGFTTYKGNSLSVTVAKFNYYGIHLDVSKPINCPE